MDKPVAVAWMEEEEEEGEGRMKVGRRNESCSGLRRVTEHESRFLVHLKGSRKCEFRAGAPATPGGVRPLCAFRSARDPPSA